MAASPTQTPRQPVPQLIADHFIAALTSLVNAGREALAASASPQAALWQKNVQPLLEARLAAAKTAAAQFSIGNHEPLLTAALPLRFLARDTDGYALDFAGEAFAAQLTERRRLVVLAAWRVCQAAGAA